MKFGILTLPLWNNYGGILQCFALKKFLSKHDVETLLINYHHPKTTLFNHYKRKLKDLIKVKVSGADSVDIYPTYQDKNEISKNTLKFIQKYLGPSTEYISSNEELSNVNSLVDGVIVGSDQVWRPNYTPNIYAYYLDFLDNDKLKIAYAASFGTDKWLYTDEETNICKSLLQNFDLISVREDSGISLVKDKFGAEAEQFIDPTLLLSKSDYLALMPEPSPAKGKSIFTYVLDEDGFTKDFINKASEKLGLDPFKVMPSKFDINYSKEKSEYQYPPVEQWISAFFSSDYVIADSFHGCVFAIIFNKPFIAIGNVERGLTRFTSLLKLFDLEERLILKDEAYDEGILYKEIDWKSVNDTHTKLRENAAYSLMDVIDKGKR